MEYILFLIIIICIIGNICIGCTVDNRDNEIKELTNKYNNLEKKHNDLVKINQALLNDNILMAIELEQNRNKKTKKSKK